MQKPNCTIARGEKQERVTRKTELHVAKKTALYNDTRKTKTKKNNKRIEIALHKKMDLYDFRKKTPETNNTKNTSKY